MSLANPNGGQRCHAHNRRGTLCGRLALRGQTVCDFHGGKAPLALAKAEERMRALVHPAISSLQRQIDKDDFAAVKYVLDYAGYKAGDRSDLHADQPAVQVTVVFDRADGA